MKATTTFFNKTHQMLVEATSPQDIFGDYSTSNSADLKRCFRILAQQVHPDHHPRQQAAANEAFQLLQKWHQLAQAQIAVKTGQLRIESQHSMYVSTAVPLHGDLCDIYPAQSSGKDVMLKIGRQPKNNDLLQAEARSLKLLRRHLAHDPLAAHFPTLIESFKMRDSNGAERFVNVLEDERSFVSLAEIMEAYPNGVHPADGAWMFNRLLAALGKTHELGIVHGAVLPVHLLLNLNDHNGKLIDWCYSVPMGETIKAVRPASKPFYPPEVLNQEPATAVTDIYMAAMTLLALLGGDIYQKQPSNNTPKPMAAFLKSCLIPAPHRRPHNVWELFDDFQDILYRLYGPPVFRPFSLGRQ